MRLCGEGDGGGEEERAWSLRMRLSSDSNADHVAEIDEVARVAASFILYESSVEHATVMRSMPQPCDQVRRRSDVSKAAVTLLVVELSDSVVGIRGTFDGRCGLNAGAFRFDAG